MNIWSKIIFGQKKFMIIASHSNIGILASLFVPPLFVPPLLVRLLFLRPLFVRPLFVIVQMIRV